jgi:hypothetical protein
MRVLHFTFQYHEHMILRGKATIWNKNIISKIKKHCIKVSKTLYYIQDNFALLNL